MTILALEQEVTGTPKESYSPHLKAEARAVLSLYERGIIREIFFTRTSHEAVMLLDCPSEEEAHRMLAELPLVREGLITFNVIALLPYDGFSRLQEKPGMTSGAHAMEYRITFAIPPLPDLWRLFLTTGWNNEYHISADGLARACEASWLVAGAYEGERLVGFGRVVSDRVLHAMIYDLITDPAWQGKGIGTTILDALVSRCQAEGIKDVQLFCAEGKRGFYERRGFRARPEDAPGMELARIGSST